MNSRVGGLYLKACLIPQSQRLLTMGFSSPQAVFCKDLLMQNGNATRVRRRERVKTDGRTHFRHQQCVQVHQQLKLKLTLRLKRYNKTPEKLPFPLKRSHSHNMFFQPSSFERAGPLVVDSVYCIYIYILTYIGCIRHQDDGRFHSERFRKREGSTGRMNILPEWSHGMSSRQPITYCKGKIGYLQILLSERDQTTMGSW